MEASGPRLRVVLADDHRLFRRGLRDLLVERGFDVVGEAENAAEAVSLTLKEDPAVVLMDIKMPGGSGIEATRQLTERSAAVQVVMLTVSPDEADVVESVQAGACGYLLKDASIEEIVAGVRAAAEGKPLLSPQVTIELLERVRAAPAPRGRPGEPPLSPREHEVLKLVSDGRSNAQISQELAISEETVKTYVSSVLEKLEVNNRIQAAVYAVRRGLL